MDPSVSDAKTAGPRALLEKLVSFPTVSRDSNLPLIDWVEGWMQARGIRTSRVYDETGQKAALCGHIGPWEEGGVLLSGHTDVVPVDGQDWTSDPFTLTERDGKLFGRGSCDMKGFVALALWAMGQAAEKEKTAGNGLARPLQIALSYDEEIGCFGAPRLIDHMVEQGFPRAAAALIGEPTEMACVTGHKGAAGYTITAKGHEVHSSLMHTGVSAIMESARIIDWAVRRNAENAAAAPGALAKDFVPPWTTLHCGKIQGGTAHNITAADCRFGLDFRFVPGDDVQGWKDRMFDRLAEGEAEMKAVHPDTGFTVETLFDISPLKPEQDGAAEALARRLTGDNATHVVSYCTEAGQFQDKGYSAIVCGPGNIEQAHQADEFITCAEFDKGQAFMTRLLAELAA